MAEPYSFTFEDVGQSVEVYIDDDGCTSGKPTPCAAHVGQLLSELLGKLGWNPYHVLAAATVRWSGNHRPADLAEAALVKGAMAVLLDRPSDNPDDEIEFKTSEGN